MTQIRSLKKMNKRLMLVMIIVVFCALSAWAGLPDERKNSEPITEKDLRVEMSTDKKVYRLGEPVILRVKVTNLTDRLLVMGRRTDFMYFFRIKAHKSAEQVRIPCHDDNGNIALDEKGYPKMETKELKADVDEVNRTALGTLYRQGSDFSFRDFVIPPYGESTSSIPANMLFDLTHVSFNNRINTGSPTLFSVELDYQVEAPGVPAVKYFSVPLEASFVVIRDKVSPVDIFNENLVAVFGKGKSIELLGDEAETLIREMREHPESQNHESPEYERLLRILGSLEMMSHDNTYYPSMLIDMRLHNKTSMDDFAELVRKCRDDYKNAQ